MESSLFLLLRLMDLHLSPVLAVVMIEVLGMARMVNDLYVITIIALVIIRRLDILSMVGLLKPMLQPLRVQKTNPYLYRLC